MAPNPAHSHDALMKASAKCAQGTAILLLTMALGGATGAPASGGGRTAPATLQRDWPSAVPAPVGTITGTSGIKPSETVTLVVAGSAQQARTRVIALYKSRGFRQATNGTLLFSKRPYQVTVVVRNRDHSATRSDLAVWLQTR